MPISVAKHKDVLINKFRMPVFNVAVWIVVGKSVRQAIDHIEDMISARIMKEEEKGYVRALTFSFEDDQRVKRFLLIFSNKATPGEIAHECKHLINMLFSFHGFKLSLTNDEMECYYLHDVVDRVHNTIKKYMRLVQPPSKERPGTR
jgi:hypothetical protein